jgi:hypothetical protein
MKRAAPLLAIVGISLLVGPGLAAAEVIELSADDRKAIEKQLGPDVIGDAAIDKKNISPQLFYHDNSKFGNLLVGKN